MALILPTQFANTVAYRIIKLSRVLLFARCNTNTEDYHSTVGHIPDKSVDLLGLDVIHFLDGILDLFLVSTNVNYEDKCVVVFNLLHSRFSRKGILKNLVLIKFISGRSADSWILRIPVFLERLWTMEGYFCPHLCGLLLEGC